MSPVVIVVGLVALERLGELALSARNTRLLLEQGAHEAGRGHFPLFILLHGGWLVAMLAAAPGDGTIHWAAAAVFALLQVLRVWVLATLGGRWTTRIIVLPGAPLVQSGPYRYLRHPNYLVVVGEIAALPLVFGEWQVAAVFTVLNGVLLAWRIKVEEAALAPQRGVSARL